jgi:tetratricopeptide (TPR) repeat protein
MQALVQIVLLVGAVGRCEDFDAALVHAREAAQRHRYAETIEILQPYASSDDSEIMYITAAEIGRAYFHLGRYQAANRAFRQAVTIHPEIPETAIYLEASSYLTGDTHQAYLIFEELLRSGARDLYLAVTLPGNRRFLAEPEVQALLAKYAVPLEVDVRQATIMGVSLGDSHEDVIATSGATAADSTARTLTAEAGPAVLWVFAFDSEQRLEETVLNAANLVDYTPYRMQFAAGIDWTATPAAAIAAWGLPTSTSTDSETGLSATWDFGDHYLTVTFGTAGALRPPEAPQGAAMIRSLRLSIGPTPP